MTTDTTPLAPTDAEIVAFAVENGVRVRTGNAAVRFARAVLAKWGTPAPVGVEPVAWRVARNKDEYELFFNKQMAERRAECFIRRPTVEPLYTADQVPAVEREPLTPREIELIDGMIEVQLDHAMRCDAIANRAMADKQKGWDMERVALLQKFKAAHGSQGGQHGTE